MTIESYPGIYLYRRIIRAKLFIEKNYAANLDVDNIAEEACFSKYHFIRLFKKINGKTPHQYLIEVRIEKAKQLLITGISISTVCYSVGFESLGSFTVLFKKTTGKTPSGFLQQQKTLRENVLRSPRKYIPGCFAERI